jgi:uncharacterized protein (TIGR03083 family)
MEIIMQTSPAPWIEALRHSHDTLRAIAGPLDAGQLGRRSYASEWSIAQVLSHLGSQAEIFGLFLDAGLSGQDPPGPDAFGPIWETWNGKSPQDQAADALRADRALTERFESLDADQRERLRLQAFGMDLDTAGLARMRLGEHAVHSWDIAVTLDPAATLPADAVSLLVDTLGPIAARSAKPGGQQRRLRVSTTSPVRHYMLDIGETVTLTPAGGEGLRPELALPAEALVRLVYGRLDPEHTPPIETRNVDLDELRQIFPGF